MYIIILQFKKFWKENCGFKHNCVVFWQIDVCHNPPRDLKARIEKRHQSQHDDSNSGRNFEEFTAVKSSKSNRKNFPAKWYRLQDLCRLIIFAKYGTAATTYIDKTAFHLQYDESILWIRISIYFCVLTSHVLLGLQPQPNYAPQMTPAETASPKRPTRWMSEAPGSAPRQCQPAGRRSRYRWSRALLLLRVNKQ